MKYIFSTLILLSLTPPTYANQQELIQKFHEAFQNVKSMKANFIQLSSDDSKLTGEFYMKRPKKMRINYNPPLKDFIVSDGTFVFYWDNALKQQSHTTVNDTIVGFLMRDHFLDQKTIQIISLDETETEYELTFTEPNYTEQGRIKLYFTKNDYQLSQWDIQDFEGNWTMVKLSNIEKNIPLKDQLFYFRKPIEK